MDERSKSSKYPPIEITDTSRMLAAMLWQDFINTDTKAAALFNTLSPRVHNLVDRIASGYYLGFMAQAEEFRKCHFYRGAEKDEHKNITLAEQADKTLQMRHDELKSHTRAAYVSLALRVDPDVAYAIVGKIIKGSLKIVSQLEQGKWTSSYVLLTDKQVREAMDKMHDDYKNTLTESAKKHDAKFNAKGPRGL